MTQTKETSEFTFTPTGEPDQLWVLSKASGDTYRVDLKVGDRKGINGSTDPGED